MKSHTGRCEEPQSPHVHLHTVRDMAPVHTISHSLFLYYDSRRSGYDDIRRSGYEDIRISCFFTMANNAREHDCVGYICAINPTYQSYISSLHLRGVHMRGFGGREEKDSFDPGDDEHHVLVGIVVLRAHGVRGAGRDMEIKLVA